MPRIHHVFSAVALNLIRLHRSDYRDPRVGGQECGYHARRVETVRDRRRALALRPEALPPGRGLWVEDGSEVQVPVLTAVHI
jgi:hypothetical protein